MTQQQVGEGGLVVEQTDHSGLSKRMMEHSDMVLALAMRRGWPARHSLAKEVAGAQ